MRRVRGVLCEKGVCVGGCVRGVCCLYQKGVWGLCKWGM